MTSFKEVPNKIVLVRKVGSDEWIILPKGHTMSMGYSEAVTFEKVNK